ncbi:hypothetical protein ABZ446_38985 [Streptomyces sp. NPDC005813]|uniref:hypothetical protein n=1 Tax=Streptomyces sp. NPDC005813 TaxID=3155592 RepID=UPI0033E57428
MAADSAAVGVGVAEGFSLAAVVDLSDWSFFSPPPLSAEATPMTMVRITTTAPGRNRNQADETDEGWGAGQEGYFRPGVAKGAAQYTRKPTSRAPGRRYSVAGTTRVGYK